MSAPPPLPGAARKSPAAGFVDVLGRISVVLGVLGVVYGVVQGFMFLLLPDDLLQRFFRMAGTEPPPLPPMLGWIMARVDLLSWATLISSLAFLLVAWGVLKRSNPARIGFIAFMVLGTLLNFVSIAVMMEMLAWIEALGSSLPGADMQSQMQASNAMSMGMGLLSALAFAALHGWIVYKLCTSAVRAEFNR